MKRPAAFLLSLLVLAAAALFGTPAGAQEEPSTQSPRLRIDLGRLSPRLITGSSTQLQVSGTVTNIGDRRIDRPQVRLQVGDRVGGTRAMSGILNGEPVQDSPLTEFSTLSESLEPGQSARLDVRVPLTGERAAHFSLPGVYPLLVNVNGTPEFGGTARLAAVSLLMPVLSSPGQDGSPTARHAKVTMLWPIADDANHVSSAAYGTRLNLTDDSLARELSPTGRLYSLVSAARAAESNGKIAGSLCFAIDPDLLRTVDTMSRGYLAAGSPGKGAAAAGDWLSSLRALVKDRCVVPMPYGDADLTTLGKVRDAEGNPDTGLMTTALSGATTIRDMLDVEPETGVLWPGGPLDDQALSAASEAGYRTVLTDGSQLRSSRDAENVSGAVTLPGGVRAQPSNGIIASALAGFAPGPQAPTTVSGAAQRAVATQNGLAAIAFEAGLGRPEAANGASLLVAPPRRWTVPTDELNAFLRGLGELTDSEVTTESSLSQLLRTEPTGSASFATDQRNPSGAGRAAVADQLSELDRRAAGLMSAMRADITNRVEPKAIVEPVRDALVRGSSAALDPPSPLAAGANANAELSAIRDQVTVEQPRQTIALASGASPLPVYVNNELPVGIDAQIALTNNVGIRPEAAQAQNRFFPAKGGKTEYLQIEALRAGRLSVDVSLTTPVGTTLGSTARFELTSTEYGPITIIVTVVAGCALLLLASRRIYRRVKESRAARGRSG
ncbi:DUF6049 family protein [Amycolatopsis jiangsuensis]|uniref:Glycoprotein n=1 Tax=Amycolatopsis jiangsuensis TaxID=1181879 RepID=A0A840J1G3_9PSEU|nr:DUF6049 family protein [Amycolatopsis jiangsuensis]MBB4687262.1 hypothetical protein [Amycolatopsis jiangsuensis]